MFRLKSLRLGKSKVVKETVIGSLSFLLLHTPSNLSGFAQIPPPVPARKGAPPLPYGYASDNRTHSHVHLLIDTL